MRAEPSAGTLHRTNRAPAHPGPAVDVDRRLVLLGFYDESTNAALLLGISLGLGALSNLLAIFIGKQQQLDYAVKLAQSPDGTWRL